MKECICRNIKPHEVYDRAMEKCITYHDALVEIMKEKGTDSCGGCDEELKNRGRTANDSK